MLLLFAGTALRLNGAGTEIQNPKQQTGVGGGDDFMAEEDAQQAKCCSPLVRERTGGGGVWCEQQARLAAAPRHRVCPVSSAQHCKAAIGWGNQWEEFPGKSTTDHQSFPSRLRKSGQ